MVISDAVAVHTEKVLSHKYGWILKSLPEKQLQDAVERNWLDKSIDRMLSLQDKTGNKGEEMKDCGPDDYRRARTLAAERMVLLSLKRCGLKQAKKGK